MIQTTTITCSVCGKQRKVRQCNQHRTDLCKRCSLKAAGKRMWNAPNGKSVNVDAGLAEIYRVKSEPCVLCGEPSTERTTGGNLVCGKHGERMRRYNLEQSARNGVRNELLRGV